VGPIDERKGRVSGRGSVAVSEGEGAGHGVPDAAPVGHAPQVALQHVVPPARTRQGGQQGIGAGD
jgi:hypothetical protein